jgi:protein ImuB
MPQDTHIPEFAVMAVGAAVARRSSHMPLVPAKAGTQFFGKALDSRFRGNERSIKFAAEYDSPFPTRPVRLFARPEPIEAIAEVPDGPPAQFTWRRVRHTVLHVEGPERIALEWWRDEAGNTLMRDYFRVESREGLRVWLFRAWPKPRKRDQEEEQDLPQPARWYLHGVFA